MPDDGPQSRPSSRAIRRAISSASAVLTVTIPSIAARSRFRGMIPSPIPGTPCVPHRCSLISGHSAGSTA